MAAMGLNKVADVNFLIPALVVALVAIWLANNVEPVRKVVYGA